MAKNSTLAAILYLLDIQTLVSSLVQTLQVEWYDMRDQAGYNLRGFLIVL